MYYHNSQMSTHNLWDKKSPEGKYHLRDQTDIPDNRVHKLAVLTGVLSRYDHHISASISALKDDCIIIIITIILTAVLGCGLVKIILISAIFIITEIIHKHVIKF